MTYARLVQTIAAASCLLAAAGCVPSENESTNDEDVAAAEQALLALPSAPTIYWPQIAGDSGHNVFIQWSKLSDATQYRLQITWLNSFSQGDTCPSPCDLNTVVSAATYCNSSTCSANVYLPGTGARSLRIRGGKTGVGGYWSSTRKFGVLNY